jgi:hypothetical protein
MGYKVKFTPLGLIAVVLLPVFAISFAFSMLTDEIGEIDSMGTVQAITITGTIFGFLYFLISEMDAIGSNRSYLANPLTDILAFLGAALIYVNGVRLESSISVFIGSAIYTIHLMQTVAKNGLEYQK